MCRNHMMHVCCTYVAHALHSRLMHVAYRHVCTVAYDMLEVWDKLYHDTMPAFKSHDTLPAESGRATPASVAATSGRTTPLSVNASRSMDELGCKQGTAVALPAKQRSGTSKTGHYRTLRTSPSTDCWKTGWADSLRAVTPTQSAEFSADGTVEARRRLARGDWRADGTWAESNRWERALRDSPPTESDMYRKAKSELASKRIDAAERGEVKQPSSRTDSSHNTPTRVKAPRRSAESAVCSTRLHFFFAPWLATSVWFCDAEAGSLELYSTCVGLCRQARSPMSDGSSRTPTRRATTRKTMQQKAVHTTAEEEQQQQVSGWPNGDGANTAAAS